MREACPAGQNRPEIRTYHSLAPDCTARDASSPDALDSVVDEGVNRNIRRNWAKPGFLEVVD
jgi:hypothetical protein